MMTRAVSLLPIFSPCRCPARSSCALTSAYNEFKEPIMLMHTQAKSRGAAPVALAGALLLSGCDLDEFLGAKDPFTVTPETASDTANLETLYAGSRSQFALAYGGLQNPEGGVVVMA